jgi:hypothetical protein
MRVDEGFIFVCVTSHEHQGLVNSHQISHPRLTSARELTELSLLKSHQLPSTELQQILGVTSMGN